MDSIKSIVVVAILLGVLYGIYQVINDDDSPVSPNSTNLLAEFDKDPRGQDKDNETNSDDESDDSQAAASAKNGLTTSMKKTVKPPPSTFDPKSTQFVFPERNEKSAETKSTKTGFQPKSGFDASFESQPDSKNESELNSSGKSGDRPDNSFSLARNVDSSDNTSINNSSFSNRGNAFKELGSGKSDGSQFQSNAAMQTAAESKINDPRSRFVSGSFVEFEKQVLGDMKQAETMIRENNFVGALKLLTKFYDDPRLTREENQNLSSWLDPLAGKVIYSVEPHLVEPYYVRPNDTLKLLSVNFHVPQELIFNINRVAITDPQNLVPGTELKMVKGPFNAEISLSQEKMTLFVKGLYAGNFKVRIGKEPVPKAGKYRVLSKSRLGQDYTDQNNQRIPAADKNNPYGLHYLNLGGGMALHGSAQVGDPNDQRGCISLNAIDAKDVHNILTTESTIIIVE